MTRNIFIIIGLLIFTFVTAMAVKLVLSFSALDGANLLDFGYVKLNLKYTVNTGINFGLVSEASSSRQILLAALAFIISAGVIIYAFRKNRLRNALAAGLFAGGGIANAYERLAYGGVFDYVNLNVDFFHNPFAFNLADIYIFLGAIFFILPGNTVSQILRK